MADARELDVAAKAVCLALADHVSHGGAIPWPSVRKPYEEWARLVDAAHCEVVDG